MRCINCYTVRILRRLAILLTFFFPLTLINCGGGSALLASLQYIPAIGGNFCHDGDSTTELFNSIGGCKSEEIFIGIEFNGGVVWNAFFDNQLGIRGSIDGLTTNILNCKNFVGLTDGRDLTAYDNGENEDLIGTADLIDPSIHTVCFTASFINMNLLRLNTGDEFLRDDVPLLTEGIWSNIEDSAQILKIDVQNNTSFTGCEIVNGVKTPIQGNFVRSDINIRVFTDLTDITFFRSAGDVVFQGDFIGVSAIELSGNGDTLQFQREPDNKTQCI